eukprot:g18175.t1
MTQPWVTQHANMSFRHFWLPCIHENVTLACVQEGCVRCCELPASCDECAPGLRLQDGACVPCPEVFEGLCATCLVSFSGEELCETCIEGYGVVDPEDLTQGCFGCESAGLSAECADCELGERGAVCKRCVEGFGVSVLNGACFPCATLGDDEGDCLQCDGDMLQNYCTKCRPGMRVNLAEDGCECISPP